MFDLSPIKILVIIAVILLVMGPDKLPQAAHQIGSAWKALRQWRERIEKEIRDVVPDLPSSGDIARIARSPVNLLNSLADRVEKAAEPESGPSMIRHDDSPRAAKVSEPDIESEIEPDMELDDPPSRSPWSVPSVGDPSLN